MRRGKIARENSLSDLLRHYLLLKVVSKEGWIEYDSNEHWNNYR